MGFNRGGIENYLYRIWKNIDYDKYELSFIDETGGKAYYRKEMERDGVRFFDVTHRSVSIKKNHEDLKNVFYNNHFDILHFNVNTLSYIAPMKYARAARVKILLHSRNSKSAIRPVTEIFHHINRLRIKNWDIKCIAVSNEAGEWLFKEKDFEVVHNGINDQVYRFQQDKRDKVRQSLNLGNKTVYGNVGAFLPAKNHSFLIDIFHEIRKNDESTVLMLVGDGRLKNDVEDKVRKLGLTESVMFMGLREDVSELMMAMDCLIFPSLFEGLPNVVLEAQTSGLPVLMSDVITDEVIVNENCSALRLNCGASVWARKGIELTKTGYANKKNRKDAYEAVLRAGFSKSEEINRIESVYSKMMGI